MDQIIKVLYTCSPTSLGFFFRVLLTLSVLENAVSEYRQKSNVCNQDILDRSFVTQCSPNICEPVVEGGPRDDAGEWPNNPNTVVHIQSTREGDRFKIIKYAAIDTDEFYYEMSHTNGTIFVDTKTRYQRILGFGTTLTDSSCTNVDDLTDDIRVRLIHDYFSPTDGIGLNLIRVPIGSTKYSYSNYVLDQPEPGQVELSAYDIDHRIPLIREAHRAAGRLKNRLKLIVSSSSAPPSYKQNNKLTEGGSLKADSFDRYASYLNGFVQAYKERELAIWAVIIGENSLSVLKKQQASQLNYNSMSMTPSDASELIRSIVRIREKSADKVDRYRLLLLGDSRDNIPHWSNKIFVDPTVKDFVAGVAYRCDMNEFAPYDNLAYSIKRYPSKYLLASESSPNTPIKLGNWQYAENYATEIVKNLAFGSVGWIDFNMALNLQGGPSINSNYTGKRDNWASLTY